MGYKYFLLFALLAVTLFITSKVEAKADTEVKGVEDAKYNGYQGGGGYPGGGGYQGGGGYPGGGGYQGGGGYPGGGGYQGGGGYPGGGGYQGGGGGYQHGGGGGGYCRYGCCGRRNYRGVCLRCCGLEAQVETKP